MVLKKFVSQKDLLKEDIFIYLTVIMLDIFYDYIYNGLLCLSWITSNRGYNPISYGLLQEAIFIFCLIQILRKIRSLPYYP